MASALQLNATATVINGHGISVSPDILSAISKYQGLATVKLVKDIYNLASGATGTELTTALGSLGSGTNGIFLLDKYPSNVTPTCSGSVSYYATIATPIYSGETITGYTYTPVVSSASFSNTLKNQANIPMANGIAGFANVYSTVSGDASNSFDTVSSIKILKDKTYSQSGLGFKGPTDLATGGVGTNGALLANVVSNWGTMYDVHNMTQFGNVYVFGQHLLNQQLGDYGLTLEFIKAGLNLGDLTKVQSGYSSTTQEANTIASTTFVGSVEYPTLTNVTVSVPVTASSPEVMATIYRTVTEGNLTSIVTATNISVPASSTITSLNDYLDLSKVTSPSDHDQLRGLGITTMADLGTYFHKTMGQASFDSWKNMGQFFRSIDVPKLSSNVSAGGNTKILSSSAVSTLSAQNTAGTGALGQPLISDYLGAMSGIPYTELLQTIIDKAPDVSKGVESTLTRLKTAVNTYLSSSGGVDGQGNPLPPDITPVTTAITEVNSSLNSISNSASYFSSNVAYNTMISHLGGEVSRLSRAHVVFNAANSSILKNFAQQIVQGATDKTQQESYQFFANVISHDEYGDTIRIAISESINSSILSGAGIQTSNDPQPSLALQQASAQNIPITTYLSQNK